MTDALPPRSSANPFLRSGALLMAIAATLFLASLAMVYHKPANEVSTGLSDLLTPVYVIFACLALAYAALRTRKYAPQIAGAWWLLALAQMLYLLGELVYLIANGTLGADPFSSAAIVFYLSSYPVIVIAILRFPAAPLTRIEKNQQIVQIAVVLLSAALFGWYYLSAPTLRPDALQDSLPLAVSIAYPMFDLLLVLAALLLIFRRADSEYPIPYFLLTISILLAVICDIAYRAQALRGELSGGWIDFGFQSSYVLLGLAGLSQAWNGGRPSKRLPNEAYARFRKILRAMLPSLMLVAVFQLLVYRRSLHIETNIDVVALWVGAIVALIAISQFIGALDHIRINRSLQAANDELETRVFARTQELGDANSQLAHANRELGKANRKLIGEIDERRQAVEALSLSRELYRTVVEDLPVLICRFRPDGVLTFVNQAYSRYFGKSPDELIGRAFLDLIPEDDRAAVTENFHSLTPENPVISYEHRVIAPDGTLRWQHWIDRAVFAGDRLIELQSIGEDITERRLAEDALRESEEKFRDLFDNSTDLILIITPDGRLAFTNNAWRTTMGYDAETVDGVGFWDFLAPDCRNRCVQIFKDSLQECGPRQVDATFVTQNGEQILVEGNINISRDPNGNPLYLRGIFRDVSARKRAEQLLIQQAHHDALTGLPNRAQFMQRLRAAIEQNQQDPLKRFAILFLDLDNFKYVNDSLGHTTGDQLLVAISARLLSFVRSHDLVARLGGDEFVILVEDIRDQFYAVQVAERILEELHTPIEIRSQSISISVSIGIVGGAHIQDAEGALRDADIAMYQAKSQGKRRFCVFEPAMRTNPIEHMRLEHDLRLALEKRELFIMYQPVINLLTRQVTGFEALLRWRSPERGLMMPGDFIPLAEESGLIVPIGGWVLETACRQMVHWQRMFPHLAEAMISVNLSARQLMQPDLPDLVSRILAESGLKTTCLALELTESVLMENIESARSALQGLTALGVSIFLDDFGAGYSSLMRLQRLPISTIKIDRVFVKNISRSGENLEILRALTTLGKELGLSVIAEGIEEDFHSTYLEHLGCTLGQGYYFSRPLEPQAIEALYLA